VAAPGGVRVEVGWLHSAHTRVRVGVGLAAHRRVRVGVEWQHIEG